MADSAREWTDEQLKIMREELHRIYDEAADEITEDWDAYMARGQERLDALYNAYINAPTAEKDEALKAYQDAVRNYTLQNQWYREMVAETTYRMAHTNEIAVAYLNGEMPKIYRENFNADVVGLPEGMGIRFDLVDDYTVRRMILDLPHKDLNYGKDMAWNARQIHSSVLQGILQGESIDRIALRLQPIMQGNEKAAWRMARTMTTGAENHGRLDRYKDLEDQGVVMNKVWIATPDGRTRDWHLDMDGQEVPADDVFIDGKGNKLEYPGDPMAAGETIYNCFIGDTMVTANTDIMRTYKHKYEGNLITVKTAGGVQFTCTPNHPILTARGWISANTLNKRDNILVTFACDNRVFRFDPDIKHIFTRFDALHQSGNKSVTKRAADLNVNFHGDIPTSDIEIVAQKGLLRDNRDPGSSKSINKFLLKSANMPFSCKGAFVQHFRSVGLSTLTHISSKCKSFTFFWRSLRHAKIHRVRPIAWGNAGCFKPVNNNGTGYIKILRKCLNGFTGLVCVDKISDIDIKFSHCDVFNLQSGNGYYFVNSIIANKRIKNNDIVAISHNCRCSMRSVFVGMRKKNGDIEYAKHFEHHGLHQDQIKAERAEREKRS